MLANNAPVWNRWRATGSIIALGISVAAATPGYCQQQRPVEKREASPGPTPSTKRIAAIYVTNPNASSLSVFPRGSNGNVPSLFAYPKLSWPSGIAYHNSSLYVTNHNSASITVYVGARPNPIFTISGDKTGLDGPDGIAVDSGGNIHVINGAGIAIFRAGDRGDVSPIARITGPKTGLKSPDALAVDSRGDIYVVDRNDSPNEPDRIVVFPPGSNGNTAPARTISGPATLLDDVGGIAVDSGDNLFVTTSIRGDNPNYCDAAVRVYWFGADGNAAPTASVEGCSSFNSPGAIAIGSNGNLYITNRNCAVGPESIFVYAQSELNLRPMLIYGPHASLTLVPGGAQCPQPIAQIAGDKTQIEEDSKIAVDSFGDMFVTSPETDSINVFRAGANGNAAPAGTIASPKGISHSTAVALDSSGQIYVANGGGELPFREAPADSVSVYPAGSYADAAPIATLSGEKTGIFAPQAVAVDRTGRIFVANSGGGYNDQGNITVYPAGSNGDIPPITTIGGTKTGDHTGLDEPVGLAFDAASNLYVLNQDGGPDKAGSITVFAPDARGNVVPKAIIANDAKTGQTGLNIASGLMLDPAGNMYVTNAPSSIGQNPDSVTVYAAGKFGNVAPTSIIAGPHTGLKRPHGIGIDADGKVYVSNDGSDDNGIDTVTVYVSGAHGDTYPIATISGPLTGLGKPGGLAIGH